MLALPLLAGNLVIDATNVPVFALLSLLAIGLLLFLTRQKNDIKFPLQIGLWLFVYYLVCCLGTFWSLNKADTIYESHKVLLQLVFFAIFYTLLDSENTYSKTLNFIRLFGAGIVSLVLWQMLNTQTTNVSAVFGHKNLLASFLLMLLPVCVTGNSGTEKPQNYLINLLFFTVLILLISLRVRSSYLALLLGLTSFIGLTFFYTRQVSRPLVFSALLLTLLLVLPVVSGFERFSVFTFLDSDSGIERIKLWKKTLHVFKEHPLFGVGSGNWQYNYLKFGLGDIDAVKNQGLTFQRPHNDFLWILSENGIIGFMMLLIPSILLAVKFHRSQKKTADVHTILLFSTLLALLVDSFFSINKERPFHLVLGCFLLAALSKQILQTPAQIVGRKSPILFASFMLLAFNLIISGFRLYGENQTQQMLMSKSANNLTAMTIHGRKAISAFYTSDPTSTPIASYVGYAYERMNRADSMLVFSEQAYRLSPFDYEVLNNYGMLLVRSGKTESGINVLTEANRINPFYEATRLNLAVAEYNSKNYDKAKQWLLSIPNYHSQYPAQSKAILEKAGKAR